MGSATVKCVEVEAFGNMASCLTNGLLFRGINFEVVAPDTAKCILNHRNLIVFETALSGKVVHFFRSFH